MGRCGEKSLSSLALGTGECLSGLGLWELIY